MPRSFPRSLWFFAILSVLGATAIIVPWVFNRSIQLSTQQIDHAISLWKTSGPTDYDLEILEAKEPGGFKKQLLIKVRNQKIVVTPKVVGQITKSTTASTASKINNAL